MKRLLGATFLASAICAAGGLLTAHAQQSKPVIKGGIEAKVKSVDAGKDTLTVTTTDGKSTTFTITDDTVLVGPRGGKVRKGLKDRRFHEGFPVTIVAKGSTATEIHLGFSPRTSAQADTKSNKGTTRTKTATKSDSQPDNATDKSSTKTTEKSAGKTATGKTKKTNTKEKDEADEDQEFPGKIKSFDAAKRLLIVTLLNGSERSFLLANSVPVSVKGVASKKGLQDPALKAGAVVEVVTDSGGRKVKGVKVAPVKARRKRAA
ncbi:MAG: hypothetical protein ACRD36_05280 [Candidatus Acidiferrum sp.]